MGNPFSGGLKWKPETGRINKFYLILKSKKPPPCSNGILHLTIRQEIHTELQIFSKCNHPHAFHFPVLLVHLHSPREQAVLISSLQSSGLSNYSDLIWILAKLNFSFWKYFLWEADCKPPSRNIDTTEHSITLKIYQIRPSVCKLSLVPGSGRPLNSNVALC